MLFSVTESVCSLFIRFGKRLLLPILVQNDNVRAQIPSLTDATQYKTVFEENKRSFSDYYAFSEGLKFYLEQPSEFVIQTSYTMVGHMIITMGMYLSSPPLVSLVVAQSILKEACMTLKKRNGEEFTKSFRSCTTKMVV